MKKGEYLKAVGLFDDEFNSQGFEVSVSAVEEEYPNHLLSSLTNDPQAMEALVQIEMPGLPELETVACGPFEAVLFYDLDQYQTDAYGLHEVHVTVEDDVVVLNGEPITQHGRNVLALYGYTLEV